MHQELGLWMAHTRYQVQRIDCIPIWRAQNTTITISTGVAVGFFFLTKRFAPSVRYPVDILPPFLGFASTHMGFQAWQLPGLCNAFLSLSTPLGAKTREILDSIRSNGKLPSHEFGSKLPATQARTPPEPTAASDADIPAADAFTPAMPRQAPAADPWGETSPAPAHWGTGEEKDAWSALPADGNVSRMSQRRTWDEIRAANAAKQSQA